MDEAMDEALLYLLIIAKQMVIFGIPGSFACAWAWEHNNRDPSRGGLIGLFSGALLGHWGVAVATLEPFRDLSFRARVKVSRRRRRWFRWFVP